MNNLVEELIKEVLRKNKEYSKEKIEFTPYCEGKMFDRGVDKETVVSTLALGKDLYYAEKQKKPFRGEIEERHKLVYKISSRYSLIIIAAYYERVLKVVNVIKTSKMAEKIWRRKILK